MKPVRACWGALGAVFLLSSCFGGGSGPVDTTLAQVELPPSNVGAILPTVAPVSIDPIVPDVTAAPVSTRPGEVPQVAPTLAATASEVAIALAEAAASATTTVVQPKESSATLATPDAASRNLWDAWRDNDRPRALQYASIAAVNVLFRDRWRPESINLGCEQTSGGWRCVYAVGNTGRLLTLIGDDKSGFRVKGVRLLGDVASAAIADTVTTAVGANLDGATPGAAGTGNEVGSGAGVVVDDTGVIETDGLPAGAPDVAPTIAVTTIPGQTRVVVKTTKKKAKTTKKAASAANDTGTTAGDAGGGSTGSSGGDASTGAANGGSAGGSAGGDQPVSVANRPVTEIESGNG